MPREKPRAALRKPPPAQKTAADADGFVFGGSQTPESKDVKTSKLPAAKTAKRLDVQTARRSSAKSSKASARLSDERGRRRMTVYLPEDLAKRLRIHCAESDSEVSAAVTDAVKRYLST
jgi:hypothetical protein